MDSAYTKLGTFVKSGNKQGRGDERHITPIQLIGSKYHPRIYITIPFKDFGHGLVYKLNRPCSRNPSLSISVPKHRN